jgi:hypothetical protein
MYDAHGRESHPLSEPTNATAEETDASGFSVASFLPSGRRYFRLADPVIMCVQEVEDEVRGAIAGSYGVKILNGYLTEASAKPVCVFEHVLCVCVCVCAAVYDLGA